MDLIKHNYPDNDLDIELKSNNISVAVRYGGKKGITKDMGYIAYEDCLMVMDTFRLEELRDILNDLFDHYYGRK